MTNAFTRDIEFTADFFEGPVVTIFEAEAQLQDTPLAFVEAGQYFEELLS